MPIYWRVESIPELAALEREERRRIWQAAYRNARKDWREIVGSVIFVLWVVGCFQLGMSWGVLGGVCGTVLGSLIGVLIYAPIRNAIVRRYISTSSPHRDSEQRGETHN
jgi:hypothetical protein